ncbi:hypothetical protein [Streptomyces sp. AA1529]|uniref:hypothetical protein n=1 Tax=Streptomyces sp. AA1529 TaxID=1203257 RepID=UPI003D737B9C
MTPRPAHAKSGKAGKKVIALAGESRYDRQVLRHLIPALHPGCCPDFVEIKKPIKLSQATTQLTPRVDELRRLAQSQAKLKNAALVGVALHVDLDRVTDDKYTRDRETIAAELRRAFTCQSALALAAVEMEAWLLLFPKAFTKFRAKWVIPEKDHRRDCGLEKDPKKYLERVLGGQKYSETNAPEIMEKAVKHGYVTASLSGSNRSFTDFVDELQSWR